MNSDRYLPPVEEEGEKGNRCCQSQLSPVSDQIDDACQSDQTQRVRYVGHDCAHSPA